MLELTPEDVRVLGCLVEKEATTPDTYPLTVNALTAACNQSTNRHPVVHYGEGDVTAALTHLRELGLTRIVYSQSNRAAKHRHVLADLLRLEPDEVAALCVLMLRGAQTVGEVKGRTERLFAFESLGDVEAVLDRLAARDEPLVLRLPRMPGQKDARYVHLLGGPVDVDALAAHGAGDGRDEAPSVPRADRVAALEGRVADLEAQLAQVVALVERLRPLVD